MVNVHRIGNVIIEVPMASIRLGIDVKLSDLQKYAEAQTERPKGSMQERVDVAVDALCTLCMGAETP